ncbi:uncharacterized protein BN670_01455 [Clostridium sp. CAG:470]|nr:MAG: hypothetical protein BHW03_02745 [Clostridium sp. 28_17]CDE15178.1 uncharacterized protein BN670_01455 [Clostridium sp. CAG:470]
MKVLFAVSNDEISESIVKRYQKNYKEIISYKNVYYFNAILKELQKDKNYDRIVISEDLEAFSNTQYSQIDKFIFDKLDSISDEASNMRGDDIPIILICSDRREKSEEMLVKLFGIGIYNALLGNDRSVDKVCELLNKPRSKKEAKIYYKIDSEDVSYQTENENDVSEVEIQNILAHYKRLGKDEKKYVESFNNIASQYNDVQLRIISKFLPLNVRAVLEEKSPKYQEIISFNSRVSDNLRAQNEGKKTKNDGPSEKLLNTGNKEKILSRPVVIPSSVNMNSTKKLAKPKAAKAFQDLIEDEEETPAPEKTVTSISKKGPMFEKEDMDRIDKLLSDDDFEEEKKPEIKKETKKEENKVEEPVTEEPKRRRGRPRKNPLPEATEEATPKRKRGRPRKNTVIEEQENITLPGLEEEKKEEVILPGFEEENKEEITLPGLEENENENILPGLEEKETTVLPEVDETEEQINNTYTNNMNPTYENNTGTMYGNSLQNTDIQYDNVDITNLLTSDKKVACFVGTSKNGTSFIVNNIADITARMGIDTAILDTTQNRNSYYIYTKNEEDLRKVAMNSIPNLLQGIANGIQVNRNLTVYTSLPEETEGIENAGTILQTLLKKHSLVLIDCDFNTPLQYFEKTQEIYLVQTFDILTIQPLTAFLRELKSKNILDQNKLRIVLNKALKLRGVNDKSIIGGMAYYNDPAMSFMTELFDKNTIRYVGVPFNEEVYTRYMENIINCEVSTKGYPKNILQILNSLADMIYPSISGKSTYTPPTIDKNSGVFSPSMNSTLNQMKNRY